MTDQANRRRPLVFAHRGGSGLAPENTMAAFANGLALGSDGIELDVHLSRDGVAVVIHDATVERTTDGQGRVAEMSAEELERVDAGHAFTRDGHQEWRGRGCRIPRLREVLARVSSPVMIELKTSEPELARVVAGEVRLAAADERVLIGSFHATALDTIRVCAPHLRRGANRESIMALAAPAGPAAGAIDFHSYLVPEVSGGQRVVTAAFVQRAHDQGAEVHVWTVDRADDIVRLLSWGVDGIITDRPDVAVPTVDEWWRTSGRSGTRT